MEWKFNTIDERKPTGTARHLIISIWLLLEPVYIQNLQKSNVRIKIK